MKTALVLGAGGFIGSHMVKRLKSEGYHVTGVDLKLPEFDPVMHADKFYKDDLRDQNTLPSIPGEFDEVYQFAAQMGGAGYIFSGDNDATVMWDSALINLNVCGYFKGTKTKIFYSSSACIYPADIQNEGRVTGQMEDITRVGELDYPGLEEGDAYPASPDSEYGWEKLFSERLYLAFAKNHGLDVRIARFHNIYGPEGTYKGGKEKAPAAMCRKVAESENITDTMHFEQAASEGKFMLNEYEPIEVWGDGQQTRSFLYIDDCIDAVRLLMQSDFKEPINIGSEEMISINDLAKMVIGISGKSIEIRNVPGPTGVRGRNSNNDLIRKVLNWEPKYSLYEGMVNTYDWISSQVNSEKKTSA